MEWNIQKLKKVKNRKTRCLFQPTVPTFKTSNRFETLKEENCAINTLVESGSISENISSDNKTRKEPINSSELSSKVKTIKNLKMREHNDDCLKFFENQNRFKVLEDISEHEISKIINLSKIKMLPKQQLKKCRNCNFKKRSCNLNQSSCIFSIVVLATF